MAKLKPPLLAVVATLMLAHDRIPHSHDGGVTCVHLNPSVR